MRQHALPSWLKRRFRQETLICVLIGFASAFAGLLVLILTLWLTFVVLLLATTRVVAICELVGWRMPPAWSLGPGLLIASLVFLVLLFIGNATMSPEYLGSIPRVELTSTFGPTIFSAAGKIITDLLFTGPRLVMAALNLFRRAVRLSRFDVIVGAEIITFLASRDSRVSFREICNRIPTINPVRIFPQFRDLDGVIFLIKDPTGLSLTDEFRAELRAVLGSISSVGGQQSETPPDPDTGSVSAFTTAEERWYHILGVGPTVSLEEVRAAYRRLMKEHHPDRVVGLGEELRALAEERAKEINQAYEEIRAKLERG